MFKLGLIINPFAGLGGTVALKGSDGESIAIEALARGAEQRSMARMQRALKTLIPQRDQFHIYCFSGDMGESSALTLNLEYTLIGQPAGARTSAQDTIDAARAMMQMQLDLILFAGGDGTARNIADAVGLHQPVLGVPAGVKMHSGVYAITPEAAGHILQALIEGRLVSISERDVKDIDEVAFRNGQVRARFYASLMVPEEPQFLQQVKNSGAQVDELAQLDVASGMIEILEDDVLYIVGPGSTTRIFLQELGLDGSLLGVDLMMNRSLLAVDVTAAQIISALNQHRGIAKIIVTAIGGQGHIIGRGNQQLTPEILRRLGRQNIQVIATRDKMAALKQQPLLIDSHDPELDRQWRGYIQVITGYQEKIMYPLGIDLHPTGLLT